MTTEALTMVRNYVGGSWLVPSVDHIDTTDPATGDLLGRVPLSDAEAVDAAVQAAKAVLPAWRATSPLVRARALFALRQKLVDHRDELAHLVTLDMGKTLADADAEIGRGIESVENACGAGTLLKGENLEGVATNIDVEMVRQPVGVVAAITPFNFPAMIPLWFLPYAIVCGNTFVLKPSEQDPLTSVRMFELIDEIEEIPSGVVNLVHGAHEAVNALLDHPDVDAVSFVGSAKTARHVYERSAQSGKRVQALGGAKNAMVVMPDADLEMTLSGVLSSAFGAAGQRCLAGSLLVLVGPQADQNRWLDAIVAAARDLKVGAGSDPATDVCPLVSPAARARVEAEIDSALEAGATLILDGRRGGGVGGAEIGPTVIVGATPDSRVATEELFGPVVTVLRAPDLSTAIELVNGSRYGNSSSIFTTSGKAAREYRFGVEAGMVGVNIGVAAPVAWFPFAGWKDSFDGDLHANGPDAIAFYTRRKVVTSRWS